jgi:AcrR family transcriptional regulator
MDHSTQTTDPRVLRTRRLFRDAFVELLQELEIEKITVNRLAERATLNRATFYLHYQDIPDMMDKMAEDMIEDIARIIDSPSMYQKSAENVDWPMMVKLLEYISEHSKFYKVILATKRTTVFTERLLQLMTKLITERLKRKGDDPDIIDSGINRDIAIWYGSSAMIGTIIAWLRNDMPFTPEYLAKQMTMLRLYQHTKS